MAAASCCKGLQVDGNCLAGQGTPCHVLTRLCLSAEDLHLASTHAHQLHRQPHVPRVLNILPKQLLLAVERHSSRILSLHAHMKNVAAHAVRCTRSRPCSWVAMPCIVSLTAMHYIIPLCTTSKQELLVAASRGRAFSPSTRHPHLQLAHQAAAPARCHGNAQNPTGGRRHPPNSLGCAPRPAPRQHRSCWRRPCSTAPGARPPESPLQPAQISADSWRSCGLQNPGSSKRSQRSRCHDVECGLQQAACSHPAGYGRPQHGTARSGCRSGSCSAGLRVKHQPAGRFV